MATWEKAALGALLFGATCFGCAKPVTIRPEPYRIPGFAFDPPAIYFTWFGQAHNCALRLHEILGDTAHYTVDASAANLGAITFIAVPTERPDGRFVAALTNKGELLVSGMTSAHGDTIWLPAPHLQTEWLVKHEAMHVFVQSPSELNYGPHGLPWGFCEML